MGFNGVPRPALGVSRPWSIPSRPWHAPSYVSTTSLGFNGVSCPVQGVSCPIPFMVFRLVMSASVSVSHQIKFVLHKFWSRTGNLGRMCLPGPLSRWTFRSRALIFSSVEIRTFQHKFETKEFLGRTRLKISSFLAPSLSSTSRKAPQFICQHTLLSFHGVVEAFLVLSANIPGQHTYIPLQHSWIKHTISDFARSRW